MSVSDTPGAGMADAATDINNEFERCEYAAFALLALVAAANVMRCSIRPGGASNWQREPGETRPKPSAASHGQLHNMFVHFACSCDRVLSFCAYTEFSCL